MWPAISAIFGAIGKVFGWVTQRDAEKNSPEARAAAAAKQEQTEVDAANLAIQNDDVRTIRNDLAE